MLAWIMSNTHLLHFALLPPARLSMRQRTV
jgi:hypothetical protein